MNNKIIPFQNRLIILSIIFAFSGCSSERRNTSGSNTIINQENKLQSRIDKYTFKIIPAARNTFGYEISDQGKTIVQQKTIPSLPGNKGFKTKDDAQKCGMFVISKLNRNIMPPTVTPKELDSLGILTNPDSHQQKP